MKGFKNSTRARSGFSFPSSAGFTTSTGKVQNISYSRKTPHRRAKFAEGGAIDGALHGPAISSELDRVAGPRAGLRPGFTRGGYASKYADGGKVSKKSPPKPVPPKKSSTPEILRSKRKEQMAELGLATGGSVTEAPDKAAKRAIRGHVAAPAPKGHKGLKSC